MNNPSIAKKAKELYQANMKECIGSFQYFTTHDKWEAAYGNFKKLLKSRWEDIGQTKPGTFRQVWNDTLDYLAKESKKLYRWALTARTKTYNKAYKQADKQIKYYLQIDKRSQKQRLNRTLTEDIQKPNPEYVRGSLGRGINAGQAVDSDEFEAYIKSPKELRWMPSITQIEINETCRKHVERAIPKTPRNRATSVDEIFLEVLNIDSRASSEEICAFWKTLGKQNTYYRSGA